MDGINYSIQEIADKIYKLKFSHAIILSSVQNQGMNGMNFDYACMQIALIVIYAST